MRVQIYELGHMWSTISNIFQNGHKALTSDQQMFVVIFANSSGTKYVIIDSTVRECIDCVNIGNAYLFLFFFNFQVRSKTVRHSETISDKLK